MSEPNDYEKEGENERDYLGNIVHHVLGTVVKTVTVIIADGNPVGAATEFLGGTARTIGSVAGFFRSDD